MVNYTYANEREAVVIRDLLAALDEAERGLRIAWVYGYNRGHNDGMSCGHDLSPRCTHKGSEECDKYEMADVCSAIDAARNSEKEVM